MLPDFETRLRAYAEVLVRGAVNLQPGQPLLLAEPYELQGVARTAEVLVEAIRATAKAAGGGEIEVQWGDPARLRLMAERSDWNGFSGLVAANASQMRAHLNRGGAFLFLLTSQPRMFEGLPPDRLAQLHRLGWAELGPIIQELVRGGSQWTLAPVPSPTWAAELYCDLSADQRLDALWEAVFTGACVGPAPVAGPHSGQPTIGSPTDRALGDWSGHLQRLHQRCTGLNAARHRRVRYTGPGTDLTVSLPRGHVWCTARQRTSRGVEYCVNVPTEEIFTAPDRAEAEGCVRVARPISAGGVMIEGIELEFHRGEVVRATAKSGAEFLRRLLDTDAGSARLGEVALVDPLPVWGRGRHFGNALLDENTTPHVALGESYPACNNSIWQRAVNRSLIHVDLPLEAAVEFPD